MTEGTASGCTSTALVLCDPSFILLEHGCRGERLRSWTGTVKSVSPAPEELASSLVTAQENLLRNPGVLSPFSESPRRSHSLPY